jgi:hypothetical protein
MKYRVLGVVVCFLCFAAQVYGDSSFDRELVIKNQGRADKVETVLRDLLRAYENEDAREFLDYVSEDRFRQDYLTFTDALYSDFRTYEIHRVDYWLDRVVPDNVKQFLYVRWEKRYETLDDARQLTERGFSRFVFDEVNGEYLLIELAGNDLFGSSLAEWTEETPSVPGQETAPVGNLKADLVMSCATFVPGPSIVDDRHHFYITNQGTTAAGESVLHVENEVWGVQLDFSINVPIILPGQTVHVEDGSHSRFQNYRLDYTSVVSESNEANNTGSILNNAVCP